MKHLSSVVDDLIHSPCYARISRDVNAARYLRLLRNPHLRFLSHAFLGRVRKESQLNRDCQCQCFRRNRQLLLLTVVLFLEPSCHGVTAP